MKTFDKLTLGEYQELYKIHSRPDTTDLDIIEKAVETISILTDKPRWEVEDISMGEVFTTSRQMAVLFGSPPLLKKPKSYLRISGKLYKVCLNPRQLTAAQFTDVQAFIKRGAVENLHKIIASIIRPVSGLLRKPHRYDSENHALISEGITELRVMEVLSISGFFLLLWNHSIRSMVPYLTQEIKTRMRNPESLQIPLQTILDGFMTYMPFESRTGLK